MSDFYITVDMPDKDGKIYPFKYHPVLYSIIKGGQALMRDKRHFFGIVTGNVGDGKSTLVAQLVALWEKENGRHISFDNIVWTTEKFIEKTDREDNKTYAIWWDEAIQGATGKKVALTKEGDMLKISLVTKRFKQHFYVLVVDEIEEYSWKLIKMCNFWIHVHTKYNERGYFKCWVDKNKIKTIYQAFKYYKWDWSRINITPDLIGRFKDYLPKLFDEVEYDKKKLEETQVLEKENQGKKIITNEQIEALKLSAQGLPNTKIAAKLNRDRKTIGEWLRKLGGSDEETI